MEFSYIDIITASIKVLKFIFQTPGGAVSKLAYSKCKNSLINLLTVRKFKHWMFCKKKKIDIFIFLIFLVFQLFRISISEATKCEDT